MESATASNFVMASEGHCFFCLNPIVAGYPGPNLSLSPPARQIDSLQYLSRYLKMDLRKVFIDKGQVSPELLAKVEKARLKVELCDECRRLNERFSEVYRQLEKLELELGSTLGLIHEKLVSAGPTAKLRGLTMPAHSNWNGLLEVLNVLREEAVQKSSCKLAGRPRVKMENLSKKEIRARQFKFANKFRSTNRESSQLETIHHSVSDVGLEMCGVKMESINDGYLSENDNGNNMPNDASLGPDMDYMEEGDETHKQKIESDLSVDANIANIVTDDLTVDNKVVSRTTRNRDGTGNWTINPETGKRKCNDCYKEFTSAGAFKRHYETVHLNLRYQCVSCNKLFSQTSSLLLHQRTSRSCSTPEVAPKFNCHLCEKSFTLKHHLQKHLYRIHNKFKLHK